MKSSGAIPPDLPHPADTSLEGEGANPGPGRSLREAGREAFGDFESRASAYSAIRASTPQSSARPSEAHPAAPVPLEDPAARVRRVLAENPPPWAARVRSNVLHAATCPPPRHPPARETIARERAAEGRERGASLVAAGELDDAARIARALAERAGPTGITVGDVRERLEALGAIAPATAPLALSWLSSVPRRAGLVATPYTRPHPLASTHGRPVRVYVLPAHLSPAAS